MGSASKRVRLLLSAICGLVVVCLGAALWLHVRSLRQTKEPESWGPAPSVDQKSASPYKTFHVGWVSELAFSPDGRFVAALEWVPVAPETLQGVVRIMDSSTGSTIKRITGASHVMSLSDHRTFAVVLNAARPSASDDLIEYWDWRRLERLRTVQVPPDRGGPRDVAAISPDGSEALLVGDGDRLSVWSVLEHRFLARPSRVWQDSDPIVPTRIAFSPNGRYLAWSTALGYPCTGGYGPNEYALYDIARRRFILRKKSDESQPGGVAFSPDGGTLAVAIDDSVELRQTHDGALLMSIPSDPKAVIAADKVFFSADGSLLFISGWDNVMRVWDVAHGKWRQQWSPDYWSELYIDTFGFSPDGASVVTEESGSGILAFWHVRRN